MGLLHHFVYIGVFALLLNLIVVGIGMAIMKGYLSFYNLPAYNFLNYELYNASNVTIWKSYDVTGYFSSSLSGFPVGY